MSKPCSKFMVIIICAFAFLSIANASENKLAGKWVKGNAELTFDYVNILPDGSCTYHFVPAKSALKCEVIAEDKIIMDGQTASFEYIRSFPKRLAINLPKQRTLEFMVFADFLKGKPFYMFEASIISDDINGIKTAIETYRGISTSGMQTKRWCNMLYDYVYKIKNVGLGKFGTANGCHEDIQFDYIKYLIWEPKTDQDREKAGYFLDGQIFTLDLNKAPGIALLFGAVSSSNIPAIKNVLSLKPNIYAKDTYGQDAYDHLHPKYMDQPSDNAQVRERNAKENKRTDEVKALLDAYKKNYTPPGNRNVKAGLASAIQKKTTIAADTQTDNLKKNTMAATHPTESNIPFMTIPVMPGRDCQLDTPTPPQGLENLALKGKASQVSTGSWYGINAAAQLAIDGNTDGKFNNKSVAHTLKDKKAWWIVDLGTNKNIKHIAIWNRTDSRSISGRLKNFSVFVINNTGNIVFQGGYCSGSTYPDPALMIDIPLAAQGQYVKIMLNNRDYLSLAEVQVFGK